MTTPKVELVRRGVVEDSILPEEIRIQQQIVRDCYAGDTFIKNDNIYNPLFGGLSNAEYYLPATENELNKWKRHYMKEALFPEFVTTFVELVVGLINFNGNSLVLDVAENKLKWLVDITTEDRGGLEALKSRINLEQCLAGQYMVMLDLFYDSTGNPQFKVLEYTSESIILHAKINGLEHIVCKEKRPEYDPQLKKNVLVPYYRIFGLELQNGVPAYWTALVDLDAWDTLDISNIPIAADPENVKVNERAFPNYVGSTLDRLPIVIINTMTLGIKRFTKVPAYELAALTIHYYHRDGRLTFGQKYAANPTVVAINANWSDRASTVVRDGRFLCEGTGLSAIDPDDLTNAKQESLTQSIAQGSRVVELGGDRIIFLNNESPNVHTDIKYLEPHCSGFASMRERLNDLKQLAEGWDLGRLLSTTGTNASAEAVSMRGQVAIADIQLIDKVSCEGISELLRIAAMWTGVSEEEATTNIEFIVNTDYVRTEFTNTNAPTDAQGRQLMSRARKLEWPGITRVSRKQTIDTTVSNNNNNQNEVTVP